MGALHLEAPPQDDTPGSHVGRVSGLHQSHRSALSPARTSHSWFAFIRCQTSGRGGLCTI